MSDMVKLSVDELTVVGTANGHSGVKVLMRDELGDVIFARGATVPTDGLAGYAIGCIFVDSDSTTTGASLYTNIGSATSCNFDPR